MMRIALAMVTAILGSSLAVGQTTQPATQSAPASQPSAEFSGILYQLKPAETLDNQPYCLDLERQSMAQIVPMLRERYQLSLCFEDLDYDSQDPHDVVSIQEAVAELQKRPDNGAEQKLSVQDEVTIALAQELAKRPDGQKLVFDSRSPRFSGRIAAATPEELLTLLTADTMYAWGKSGRVLAIFPRNKSILRYRVTLRAKEGTLGDLADRIVQQRPSGLRGLSLALPPQESLLSFGQETADRQEQSLASSPVSIPYFQGSAIEALCKLAEEAGHGVVWQVTGFKGARCLSLFRIAPVARAATQPAARD